MQQSTQKWLKYDLHMHSQYSNEIRTKEMSAKEFVDTLISKKIDVFSITDHDVFSEKYYTEILKYIEDKPIKCIFGAELNVYINNGKNKFQCGFYFSPSSNLNSVESAIKELYDGKKPKFSEIIDKLYEKGLTFIMIPEADKSGGIREIWAKLSESDHDKMLKNGMQKVFRAYDSTASFDKTSADMWALNYYKATEEFDKMIDGLNQCDIKKITNEVSKKIKALEKNEIINVSDTADKIAEIVIEYGRNFSYFRFSDWHNKENYEPKFYNYIYGTLELPFETLELAVLDPYSRIDVLNYGEEKEIPSNYIKSVHFTMNNKEYEVDFGIALNAIIGKRASGKSLLMAILLYLKGDESLIKKYENSFKIDKNSIYCYTFGGYKITKGQLSSTEYIKQNDIEKIFEDPSLASKSISKYFPEVPDINNEKVELLKNNLSRIKKFDINYKSISSYIKFSKKFNNYEFNIIKIDSFEKVKKLYDLLYEDITRFQLALKEFGYSNKYVSTVEKELKKSEKIYYKMYDLYCNIAQKVNKKILNICEEYNGLKMLAKQARLEYREAKNVVLENFDNLLYFKKSSYIFENLSIEIPNVNLFRKSKYLFVTGYKKSGNPKEIILDKIFDTINKKKLGSCNELSFRDILKYMNGSTDLKSGSTNLTQFFKSEIFKDTYQKINKFYEIKEEVNLENLKTFGELDELANRKVIEDISNSSLGRRSILYLELILDLEQSILLFDQPEDNVDNNYISCHFVPLIKEKKKDKQLIFVTHNPSVAVYADAFNYIFASNDKEISYVNYVIESPEDKEEILNILDGGSKSFSNRNQKYGNIIGEYKYGKS